MGVVADEETPVATLLAGLMTPASVLWAEVAVTLRSAVGCICVERVELGRLWRWGRAWTVRVVPKGVCILRVRLCCRCQSGCEAPEGAFIGVVLFELDKYLNAGIYCALASPMAAVNFSGSSSKSRVGSGTEWRRAQAFS